MKPRSCHLGVLLLLAGAPAAAGQDSEPARAYEQARGTYFTLKASAQKQRFRHHWLKAIAGFNAVAAAYPDSRRAADALYTAAELWRDLHRISWRRADLDHALAAYGRLAREHPGSPLADDALWQTSQIHLARCGDPAAAARAIQRLLARYPQGDMAPRARALWPKLATTLPQRMEAESLEEAGRPLVGRRDEGGPAPAITGLKHWSNSVYSRVVVYLDAATEARDVSPAGPGPRPAVAVDLVGARLAATIGTGARIEDELLAGVRLHEHAEGTGVRLTLELKRSAQHRLMVLEAPYRLVVDAFAAEASLEAQPTRPRLVVLDPGHGGHDAGATSPTGTAEKTVVLDIARRAEALLIERGVDVVLTRGDDRYVALEERTAIANRAAADLFVSIHANAYDGAGIRGVETYYLDTTDDRYSLRLAARENATQEEQVSDVQLVLADLATKVTTRESRALALEVQRQLVAGLRPLNPRLRDLGVKGSLFYVLLGARMPAILVETSFLSNPDEDRLLASDAYRDRAARAIVTGVTSRLRGPFIVARP